MALPRAFESVAPTDHELSKHGSSADILPGLFLRDTRVTAVLKLLAQYSKTFVSSSEAFFQDARWTDTARELVSCEINKSGVGSSCRRCVPATKQMRRFSKALQLVENVNAEAESGDSSDPEVFWVLRILKTHSSG